MLGPAGEGVGRVPPRIAAVLLLTWGVPAALAWLHRPGFRPPGRESFFHDVASWAQLVGFVPLALVAEPMIDDRMRSGVRHLRVVVPTRLLVGPASRAIRQARSPVLDATCLALAYVFTWLWAWDELTNGIASWHAQPAGGRFEQLTPAG
jgi:hypothetical protein